MQAGRQTPRVVARLPSAVPSSLCQTRSTEVLHESEVDHRLAFGNRRGVRRQEVDLGFNGVHRQTSFFMQEQIQRRLEIPGLRSRRIAELALEGDLRQSLC